MPSGRVEVPSTVILCSSAFRQYVMVIVEGSGVLGSSDALVLRMYSHEYVGPRC